MTEHDYNGDPDGGEDCSPDCLRCCAIREIEQRYADGWSEIVEHVVDLEARVIELAHATPPALVPVDWHKLGEELRDDLSHAVATGYRNHFCAEVSSQAANRWELLVGMGLAKRGPLINDGRYRYYHVVDPRPWLRKKK